ncbi:MAG: T9SS type A sorting domain-containing protein, partial [Bacteroidota bacterium]
IYPIHALGIFDVFISKLDSAGNFIWAKSIGNNNALAFIPSIVTDATGNIYTTGQLYGTIDIDPGSSTHAITSTGGTVNSDAFILKLDTSGNFINVKQIKSYGACSGSELTSDAIGNIYATGVFYGQTNFDPGASNTSLNYALGIDQTYILKLGSSVTGNQDVFSLNLPITIFPNPNNGSFNIVAKEKMNLNLIDNLGQIIQSIELYEGNSFQQNIKVLSSGIYFISGQSDKKIINQKIIISK